MNKTLTYLVLTAFVFGALVMPVQADQSDDRPDPDERRDKARDAADERRDKARDAADERRDKAREEADARRDAFKQARDACKEEFKDRNGTENGTYAPGRCISMAAHDPAHKARRAYHHISHHIDAVEHRIAKLEVKEYRIEEALAGGNLTENQTAAFEAKLERIEALQGELVEKLEDLYQQLRDLRERWADHKAASGDDPAPYPEDDSALESDDEVDASSQEAGSDVPEGDGSSDSEPSEDPAG